MPCTLPITFMSAMSTPSTFIHTSTLISTYIHSSMVWKQRAHFEGHFQWKLFAWGHDKVMHIYLWSKVVCWALPPQGIGTITLDPTFGSFALLITLYTYITSGCPWPKANVKPPVWNPGPKIEIPHLENHILKVFRFRSWKPRVWKSRPQSWDPKSWKPCPENHILKFPRPQSWDPKSWKPCLENHT